MEIGEETAAELARRVMWLDGLIRLHVGRGSGLAMLNAQLQLVASELDRELIDLEKRVRR